MNTLLAKIRLSPVIYTFKFMKIDYPINATTEGHKGLHSMSGKICNLSFSSNTSTFIFESESDIQPQTIANFFQRQWQPLYGTKHCVDFF